SPCYFLPRPNSQFGQGGRPPCPTTTAHARQLDRQRDLRAAGRPGTTTTARVLFRYLNDLAAEAAAVLVRRRRPGRCCAGTGLAPGTSNDCPGTTTARTPNGGMMGHARGERGVGGVRRGRAGSARTCGISADLE